MIKQAKILLKFIKSKLPIDPRLRKVTYGENTIKIFDNESTIISEGGGKKKRNSKSKKGSKN